MYTSIVGLLKSSTHVLLIRCQVALIVRLFGKKLRQLKSPTPLCAVEVIVAAPDSVLIHMLIVYVRPTIKVGIGKAIPF